VKSKDQKLSAAMNKTSAGITNHRQQIVAAYRKLTALEQKMVQLFSVIYEPVSRTLFLNCWNQVAGQTKQGKTLNAPTLKPYIDRLIADEILIQQPGQGPQCHPWLVEIATRDAVETKQFNRFVEVVEQCIPITLRIKGGPRYFSSDRQLTREVRIGIYQRDVKFINKQMEDYTKYFYKKDKISFDQIFHQVVTNPFDAEWFRTLPAELYESGLIWILDHSVRYLTSVQDALALLQEDCENEGNASVMQRIVLTEQLLLRGELEAVQIQLTQLPSPDNNTTASLWGWLSFLQGDYETAIAYYTTALQALRKNAGKRKPFFKSPSGLFFILALLKLGTSNHLKEALEYVGIAKQEKDWLSAPYGMLERVVKMQQGDVPQKQMLPDMSILPYSATSSLNVWISCLCIYWADADKAKQLLPKHLKPLYEAAEAAGYTWLAIEMAELLSRLNVRGSYNKKVATLRKNCSISAPPLADLIQPQEEWEMSLTALTNLQKASQMFAKPELNQRLVWLITFYSTGHCVVQPREQSLSAKGEWSKGRPIALKRLKNSATEFAYLTPQDLRACSHIKSYNHGYYGQVDYTFDEKTITALIGHPLVFWEVSPTTRVEVVKGEPELLVKQSKNNLLTVQLVPQVKENQDLLVVKETPTRLKVIELTTEHRRIAEILGKGNCLQVPVNAKERVLQAIHSISNIVTIQSDIGGGTVDVEEVPSDAKPHVHLLPAGEGLKVAVLSRPFAQGGSYYRPGMGGATVIAEIEGKRVQTTRDLKEEKKLAQAAIAVCPTFLMYEEQEGEWLIEEPEDCLELLLELQDLGDSVTIEWPEGEKIRVSHRADFSDFTLKIQRQNDWFATSGELKLDNDTLLDMQRLMELLDRTPSRFVPIGDGQFLALTQEFRKRLDELRAFSEKSGKGLRMHPLAAIALEDWMDEVGDLKADKYWKSQASERNANSGTRIAFHLASGITRLPNRWFPLVSSVSSLGRGGLLGR
jgi:hypothetical protein